MPELLWVRIIFLVVGILAYLGIGSILLTQVFKKTKGNEFGPPYFWLLFWPLPVIAVILAVMVILVAVAIIIALVVGFIVGTLGSAIYFLGGFLVLAIVVFFAFVAWMAFVIIILSPFGGFDLFTGNIKKLPGYLMGRHRK